MNIINQIKVCSLLLFVALSGYSQENSAHKVCKDKIEGYLSFLLQKNKQKGPEAYYLEYTTENFFNKDLGLHDTKSNTKILSSESMLMMEDENIKIYAKDKSVVMILPKNQRIYINDTDPRMFSEQNSYEQLMQFETILLNTAKSITCEEEQNGMKVFRVYPSDEFSKKVKLKMQLITYSIEKKRVYKVENIYNENSKVVKQVVHYTVMDFDSKRSMRSPNTYLYIGTKLRPEFKAYEIIDNRNKTN